ncbi:MAG: hypothetical protein A3G34_15960 [Candidatus Lindowbacteria bacterium RIFCSPLOWO2_12_FULL_62_27]|nr:MAG: hypothetical protein A3G34_15960 [Candidatus Lindowbacteria bacterium RIFCSPLOWO2_12_FULL_62_27]
MLTQIPVAVESGLCSRYLCSKSDCDLCARACPVDAVQIGAEGARVSDACIACGACVPACPNGAIEMRGSATWTSAVPDPERQGCRSLKSGAASPDLNGGFDAVCATDRQWGLKFRRLLDTRPPAPRILNISCSHSAGADAVLVCLGRLTVPVILESFRHGAARVEILKPSCETCPMRSAGAGMERTVEIARRVMKFAGIEPDRLSVVAAPFCPEPAGLPAPLSSRRTFLKSAVGQAAAILPEPDATREEKSVGEKFRERILRKIPSPRRQHLLELIESLRDSDGATTQTPADTISLNTVTADPAANPANFAGISVSQSCMGCNVCESLCPTDAIRRVESGNVFELYFDPKSCTACGVCAAACLPKAITISRTADPAILFAGERKLIESRRQICRACRASFVSKQADDPYCPLCMNQERKRRAMARRWVLSGNG